LQQTAADRLPGKPLPIGLEIPGTQALTQIFVLEYADQALGQCARIVLRDQGNTCFGDREAGFRPRVGYYGNAASDARKCTAPPAGNAPTDEKLDVALREETAGLGRLDDSLQVN
jgi:hypothetical protein